MGQSASTSEAQDRAFFCPMLAINGSWIFGKALRGPVRRDHQAGAGRDRRGCVAGQRVLTKCRPPLHIVERGTLKDSLTVAGGDDPSSQQWEPTVPSRVAAKAAARHVPLKRQCCARLRAKAESRVHSRTSPDQSLLVPPLHNVEGGQRVRLIRPPGRPPTRRGDSLTLAILWLRARTPNP